VGLLKSLGRTIPQKKGTIRQEAVFKNCLLSGSCSDLRDRAAQASLTRKSYTVAVPLAPATANRSPVGLSARSRQFVGTVSVWALTGSSPFQNHTRPCPAPPAATTAPDG
jgi:hypothetical protein